MKFDKLVSVIIPTYNRCELVLNCVKSICDSTYPAIEIIVVDNNSSDDTLCELNKVIQTMSEYHGFCRTLKVVALAENIMASGGRNAGILVAEGEYILFVDDDNEIYPDMIEKLVNAFESDCEIGLAAPLAFGVTAEGKATWTTSISYNWWTSKCYDTFPECVGRTEDEVDRTFERRYETLAGSPNAFMVSRKALDAVGGFDFSMYMTFEEGDFALRIIRAGYKEYIYTDARTNHISSVRSYENSRLRHLCIDPADRAYYFCRNRTVFMKRYARWYHLVTYYLIFFHLFTIYYSFMAFREKRLDIVRAVIRGAYAGLFVRNDNRIVIPINRVDYRYKD